ncbi:glucose PTS transporter subunit EIIB, partial [Yersinia enterocolitica]|uniref:glucose PTS transporter subunit EIIB n=1 Tax=Yersinia enterocolitica TaxID=630 RepID=UPI003CFC906A
SSRRGNKIPFRRRIDSSKPTYRQNRCCKNGSDHRFRFAIQHFNIKTPGRENETTASSNAEKAASGAVSGKSGYNSPAILAALGGADNIVSLDNCITRLRMSVKDMNLVDKEALKANRAIGVIQLNDHNLQVVIGPQVQSVKDELDSLIGNGQFAIS